MLANIYELGQNHILLKTIYLLYLQVVQYVINLSNKRKTVAINSHTVNKSISFQFSSRNTFLHQKIACICTLQVPTPICCPVLFNQKLSDNCQFLLVLMTAVPPTCLSSIASNSVSGWADLQDSQNTCDDYLDKDVWNSIFPQYGFIQLLCETDSSLVWLGCQIASQRRVALKITQKIQKGSSVYLHQQSQKAFVTQNQFKHMVKMLQIRETDSYRLIVMEYYPWNLIDLLSYFTNSSNRRYTQSHLNFIAFAFSGILRAVIQLHQLGYVHRDLKLDNFMLDQNLNIRLNDFELVSKELVVDPSLSGTLEYMAPQRLSKKRMTSPITRGVDIWSLGIILYQLFTGQTPYNGQNQDQILQEIYQNYLNVKQIPQDTMILIRQMLQIRPEKRLQQQQIKNSSILQRSVDLDLIRGLIAQ